MLVDKCITYTCDGVTWTERAEALSYHRKIIKITAEDSPNVKFARAQIRAGLEPTNEIVIPGVLPWADYVRRRETWDKIKQTIGLDAEFYEGFEVLLFPPAWLDRAEMIATSLRLDNVPRAAGAMGIDPAEGGDKTAISVIDSKGLIELVSKPTPNTQQIIRDVIRLGQKYAVPAEKWVFDQGGGGKQLADQLREMGHRVQAVAFGAAVNPELQRSPRRFDDRKDDREARYVYKNRRAQMFGLLREKLDPSVTPEGFGIPAGFIELRRQMTPIPLTYDGEGRMYVLPKRKRHPDDEQMTLEELIGCSPDELDSLVLAMYGLYCAPQKPKAGAVPGGRSRRHMFDPKTGRLVHG